MTAEELQKINIEAYIQLFHNCKSIIDTCMPLYAKDGKTSFTIKSSEFYYTAFPKFVISKIEDEYQPSGFHITKKYDNNNKHVIELIISWGLDDIMESLK